MHRTIGWLLAAGFVTAVGSSAAHAGDADLELFGYDPEGQRAAACFVRVYDDAHLAIHPQQNVTSMKMLVDGQGDIDERWYGLSLGVTFRTHDQEMRASGGCGVSLEGEALISCGIDCDGGTIAVRMRDADSILVDIPDGARTWDPNEAEDADLDLIAEQARFGDDDKVFRLDRADLSQCVSLSYDDELTALLAKGN